MLEDKPATLENECECREMEVNSSTARRMEWVALEVVEEPDENVRAS